MWIEGAGAFSASLKVLRADFTNSICSFVRFGAVAALGTLAGFFGAATEDSDNSKDNPTNNPKMVFIQTPSLKELGISSEI